MDQDGPAVRHMDDEIEHPDDVTQTEIDDFIQRLSSSRIVPSLDLGMSIDEKTGIPRFHSPGPTPFPDEDYRKNNFAYKGIAVRLDKGEGGISKGKAWLVFDHDLKCTRGELDAFVNLLAWRAWMFRILTAFMRWTARAVNATLLCHRYLGKYYRIQYLLYPTLSYLSTRTISLRYFHIHPPLPSYSYFHPHTILPLPWHLSFPSTLLHPSLLPPLTEQEKCPEFGSKVQGSSHRGTIL